MKKKLLVLISLYLCGCQHLHIRNVYTPISENIPNKILNTTSVDYNNKSLFKLKAKSHKDPTLKENLIRQEYFINFNF